MYYILYIIYYIYMYIYIYIYIYIYACIYILIVCSIFILQIVGIDSFSFAAEILVMLEVTYALSNSPIKQHHAASPLQAQYE